MAEVESAIQSESEEQAQTSPEPRLSWDTSVKAVPLGRGWDAQPCILEWSGSGRAELLVSSEGSPRGRMAWLYLPTDHREAESVPVFDAGRREPTLDGLSFICPLPNGRDSRFDLVALDSSGLVHLPNRGSAHEPAFGPRTHLGLEPDLGIKHAQVVQMTAIDWNQDGLVDLLVGIHDMSGYWPDSGLLPPTQQIGLNQRAGHPCYDREGLWRGRAPVGRIFWLRNAGSHGAPQFELEPEITGEAGPLDIGLHPAPLAVSWGGRGSTELLVSDHRGLLRVYRNFGGQLPPVLMEPRTLQCGGAHVVLHEDRVSIAMGDIDGDGRTELVYGTSAGRLFAIHAGPTRNEARDPAPIMHLSTEVLLGGHASVCPCDLDADGDLDLVYGDGPGRLYYLEDLGSGDDHRYALPVPIEVGGAVFRIEPGPDGMMHGPAGRDLGFARPTAFDWLEHDRADLIVAGAGGDVLVLPNDGAATDPRFGHPVALRCEGAPLILAPRVQPAVARWGEDEILQLLGLDLQGFLCAYPKSGKYEVGPPAPIVDHLGRLIRLDGSFGLSGRCALWAGAWTAPDRVDLLVGLARGNRHVVPSITGIPLDDAESLPTVLLLENLGRGTVTPRPLRYRDGRPVAIGQEGCSPRGVGRSGRDLPDLLVGGDDGTLTWITRDELSW
jgi:hypothetical protein